MDYGTVKIVRLNPGHYVVEGTGYHIFQEKGRSWSGHQGAYAYTKWYFLRGTAEGFEKDDYGHHREILSASTLEGLRKKINRYFTPRVVEECHAR